MLKYTVRVKKPENALPFLLIPNRMCLHAVELAGIYGAGQQTGHRTFPVVDLNRIFLTFERAALYGAGQTTGEHTVPFFDPEPCMSARRRAR